MARRGHRHRAHRHHRAHAHHRHHRVGGFGRRRRRMFGRRRHRHTHRTGGGGMNLLLCCFGLGTSDPNQALRKDVQELQTTQQQFLAYHQTLQQPGQFDPTTLQTEQAVAAAHAKEIQDEQRAILDDILRLQMEERDPEKLEELQKQTNIIIQQMQAFQASGFHYEGGIPQGQPQGQNLSQPQPMYTGPQPMNTVPQPIYTGAQPMYTGQGQSSSQPQPMDMDAPPPSYESVMNKT